MLAKTISLWTENKFQERVRRSVSVSFETGTMLANTVSIRNENNFKWNRRT